MHQTSYIRTYFPWLCSCSPFTHTTDLASNHIFSTFSTPLYSHMLLSLHPIIFSLLWTYLAYRRTGLITQGRIFTDCAPTQNSHMVMLLHPIAFSLLFHNLCIHTCRCPHIRFHFLGLWPPSYLGTPVIMYKDVFSRTLLSFPTYKHYCSRIQSHFFCFATFWHAAFQSYKHVLASFVNLSNFPC